MVGAAINDDPPRAGLPAELQRTFAVLPCSHAKSPLRLKLAQANQFFHSPGLFELEQIVQSPRFEFLHPSFCAIADISTHELGKLLSGAFLQPIQSRAQPERARGLIAWTHLHIKAQAQMSDPKTVIGVTGSPWLCRIITQHRPCLFPVERLDRDIHIQKPQGTSRDPVQSWSKCLSRQQRAAASSPCDSTNLRKAPPILSSLGMCFISKNCASN